MATAIWNGAVLARSDDYEVVEGIVYFPPASLDRRYFRDCDLHTQCHWKGDASYYDIEVNGEVNPAAAWYYAAPKPAAVRIRDYVAFWNGVEVTE